MVRTFSVALALIALVPDGTDAAYWVCTAYCKTNAKRFVGTGIFMTQSECYTHMASTV